MEWLKGDRVIGVFSGLIATVLAFAVAEPQALGLATHEGDSPQSINTPGAGQAVWRSTEGVMPNGKPAGLWTLPDGFSFRGAGDLTQERVRSLATALRRSGLGSSLPGSPADPLERYMVSRLESGVTINELRALTGAAGGSAVYPGVSASPSQRDYMVVPQYDLGSIPAVGSTIISENRDVDGSGAYAAGVGGSQPVYRRGDSVGRVTEYDKPSGNIGLVNSRSGEYYAPAGDSGYVSTRDGTYYSRSGPNGVIDTRTGRYIPTN